MTADRDLDAGIAATGLGASPSAPAVIHAARALFDELAFRDVSVGMVARAAGVNEVTIYRIFGSKDGLAAACWLGNMEKLRRGIRRDRRVTKDPRSRIVRHLRRLADLSDKDRTITFAMMQAVQTQTIARGSKIGALDPRTIVAIPHLLERLVADAQQAGQLEGKYTSFELAAFLTNSVFVRFMTRPGATATEVATFVADVVLDGISTSPRRS